MFWRIRKKRYLCKRKRTRGACSAILGYGVMVTLQILVLPFLVRIRVSQHFLESVSNLKNVVPQGNA